MIDLYRLHLQMIREETKIDVFVIPSPLPVEGVAFCSLNKRYINISGSVHSLLWLFVLYHEVFHHRLGHVGRWTSTPVWLCEFQADAKALEMISLVQPYVYSVCERASKTHIRPMLQSYIDAEIYHHVDVAIARWAGCDLQHFKDDWDINEGIEVVF
jgi:hypothetical protein